MNLKPKTVLPHLPEVPSGLDALAHTAGGGQRALSDADLEQIAGGTADHGSFKEALSAQGLIVPIMPGDANYESSGDNLSDVVIPGFGGAAYVDAAQTIAEGDIQELLKALDPNRGADSHLVDTLRGISDRDINGVIDNLDGDVLPDAEGR